MLHAFALCFHSQQVRLVWVAGSAGGDFLRLIPPEGTPFRYRLKQLLHRWEAEAPALTDAAAPGFLRDRAAELEDVARQVDLAALHRQMPAGQELAVPKIGALVLYGDPDEWALAGLYLALLRDGTRFRRGDTGFVARPADEQEQRAAKVAEAAAAEAWAAQATAWGQALEQGQWPGADDPQGPRFLAQLTSLLALEKQSPHWAPLAKPLGLHGQHPHEAAPTLKRWLETASAWPGWPEIWLLRAGVQRTFPPEVAALAGEIALTPPRTDARTDYTSTPTYTMDAIDTFDYDDAYSILEADAGGLTVAVHIAEPPPELTPGHLIFDVAADRISSVYTPHGIYPMLPPALSLGRCSLQKGEPREVVTCRLRVSSKGAELLGIERGLIRVAENLDYARAETLLRAEPETWGRLGRLADSLTQARIANGAVVTVRKEVKLNLADPEHVTLSAVSRHGGVHRVIEELAIAYNSAIGDYCAKHALPAFFRVQSKRKSTPDAGVTAQPMLPPARYSLIGGRHAGLGAAHYVHCTSPLRRFPDLVTQRQVIEHVTTGRVAYADSALLDRWLAHAELRQSAYDDVERTIDEHWSRIYLRQNSSLELQATVRRNEHGHGRVFLDDVRLMADAKLPPYSRPGGQVTVRVTDVNLDTQRVQVEAQ